MPEYYEERDGLPSNETLQEIKLGHQESSETTFSPSTASSPCNDERDPGLPVLFGPQFEHHTHLLLITTQSRESGLMSVKQNMTDKVDEPPLVGESLAVQDLPQSGPQIDDHGSKNSVDSAVDLSVIADTSEKDSSASAGASRDMATRPRADSTQADALMAPKVTQSTRVGLESPLKIRTTDPDVATAPSRQERDSISTSPTLSKHVKPVADVLAPFEPPSPSTSSPKAERLPSIHQLTSSLTELAEAATQEIPRQQQGFSHHHSQSFGSAMSHSPILSGHAYPPSIHTSPQAYYPAAVLGRSPTSTIGGESHYASPPMYPSYGTYSHRRASINDGVPPVMPRLPTASSSGDSYGGYPSSGTEGYSTSHTTPIDASHSMEHTPRPMLPPPPGMHALPIPSPPIMIPGPYKCDVPNCTAGTFQTQYLLKYVQCSAYRECLHLLTGLR